MTSLAQRGNATHRLAMPSADKASQSPTVNFAVSRFSFLLFVSFSTTIYVAQHYFSLSPGGHSVNLASPSDARLPREPSTANSSQRSSHRNDNGISTVSINDEARPASKGNIPSQGLPPTISSVYTFKRDSPEATWHLEHDFSKPLVMTSYVRPSQITTGSYELYIYMTGVAMGSSKRNFTVDGCLVGDDVYPPRYIYNEQLCCDIPRYPAKGELVSVVLRRNEVLKRALEGPVQLSDGFVATLADGDIVPLADSTRLHGSLGAESTSSFMRIRSKEHFNGLVDHVHPGKVRAAPRFRLCLMTQIKPFTGMLPDWVDYYRRIGVDKVFIFDNGAPDDFGKQFAGRDDVEVVFWPWNTAQSQSFSFFLMASRSRCEWVMFCDVDEYVMFGIGEGNNFVRETPPFKEHVDRVERTRAVQYKFLYLVMANSGHISRPTDPVPEAYIHRRAEQDLSNGKSVCKTDEDWIVNGIHACKLSKKISVRTKRPGLYPKTKDDVPSIVHFQWRGLEDMIAKRQAGRQTTGMVVVSQEERKRQVKQLENRMSSGISRIGVPDGIEYTHFRDIWRRITKEMPFSKMAVVQEQAQRRCVWEFEADRVGDGPESKTCKKLTS